MRNDDSLSVGAYADGVAPLVVDGAPPGVDVVDVAAPIAPSSWVPIAVGPS